MKRSPAAASRTAPLLTGLICLAWLAISGCGELRHGHMSIELVSGCQPRLEEILQVVQMYCISIEQTDGSQLEGPNCSTSLEGVQLEVSESATPVVVVVEGYERLPNDKHQMVLRGKSAPVSLVSGEDDEVVVPASPVGFFGLLAADEDGCEEMPFPLVGHTATVFPSGHVVLVGSTRQEASLGRTALLIDTRAQEIESIDTPISLRRGFHAASLLDDGRLLIAGGVLASSDSPTGEMVVLRGAEPMLDDYDRDFDYLDSLVFESLERFLRYPRRRPNASVFFGSQVLINDGDSPAEMFMGNTETSDLLDISGENAFPQNGRTVTAVPDGAGKAVLLGAWANRVGRLTVANGKREAIYVGYNTSVSTRDKPVGMLLSDGRVMFIGLRLADGVNDSLVVIDPAAQGGTPSLTVIPAPLGFPEYGFTASLLADGRVFVIGGETIDGRSAAGTFFIEPVSDERWEISAGPDLNIARRDHTAFLLPDGRLLVVGGDQVEGSTSDPALSIEVIAF